MTSRRATSDGLNGRPGYVVKDVKIAYPGTVLLGGLNVCVGAGESLAVVGPSGSGKSSLLDCLVGLSRPAHGVICLGDTEISSLSDGAARHLRRTAVGIVRQNADLLEELSVLENVAIAEIFGGCRRDASLAHAGEVLEMLSIAHLSARDVSTLSGGESQRVSVARALCRNSLQGLVADEPTAALDKGTALEVASLLVEASRTHACCLVLATHDPDVANLCTSVLDLRDLT